MKFSEVSVEDVKEDCKASDEDIKTLSIILPGAKSYIKSHTGRSEEDLDNYEDITIALLVLCNEMFENRLYSAENSKVNHVIESIINMYAVNLL